MSVRVSGPPQGAALPALDRGLLRRRAGRVLAALGRRGAELSVALVDDAEIAALNGRYRGKPRPTDVLSFSLLDGAHAEHRGAIEIAPLAFMRGRTLNHSFVILDEAQNTTPEQMKMFLTRIGFGSKAVVTGDVTQIDLARGQKSGLVEASDVLRKVRGIAFTYFDAEDVVRHPLVQRIVNAYGSYQSRGARRKPGTDGKP